MDSSRNKLIVREYAEAFSRGDVDAVCRCFAPDAVVYGVLGWGEIAKARPIWESLVRSFRIQLRIESMVAEGELVAARYTETGKFVSEFRGTAPTGRKYELVAMEWFEVGEQGIQRRWGARDSAAMFRQLGIPLA
jgi:predicted ester cyclase